MTAVMLPLLHRSRVPRWVALAAWLAAGSALAGTTVCQYDPAGRLTNVSYGARSIAYAYDAGGNLLQRIAVGGAAAQADVSIRKTGEVETFEFGRGNLVYWLTVSNAGPDAAANVLVTDPLPAGTLFAAASTGAANAGVFQAALGGLASGSLASVRLELVPLATGTFVNVAAVTNDVADPDPLDDIARFTNFVVVATDTNANGLPDWWENYWFTNPAERVPGADVDHDSVNNGDEYAGNTDPTSSNSWFHIESLAGGAPPALSFLAQSGRVYRVDGGTGLVVGAWDTIRSNIPGRGASVTAIDTNTANERSYRVQGAIP